MEKETWSEATKIDGGVVFGKVSLLMPLISSVVSMIVFFTILYQLNDKFEKIVISILAIILYQMYGEALLYDLEKYGKSIPASSAMLSMLIQVIPKIIVSVTLIYIVFLTT